MTETDNKLCRICLTTNNEDKISDSSNLIEVFSELVKVKKFKKTLWLCMWCRSTLNRTKTLKKVALYSEKVLCSQETLILADIHHHKKLHQFSYSDINQIDIQPENVVKKSQEIILENIDNTNSHRPEQLRTENNIQTLSEDGLIFNEILLKENHSASFLNEEINIRNYGPQIDKTLSNNKNATQPGKKKKNEIKNKNIPILNRLGNWSLNDMKIEVKYLNMEEQMVQIEKKRLKFKNMKFQCELCGVGFLTSDYFEKHKVRHSEASGPHKCPLCHLYFKSKLVLSQHILCHKRLFVCLICGVQFNKRSYCTIHSYKCAGNFMSLKHPRRQQRVSIQNKYSCEHCKSVFKTKQRLEVHIRSVHLKLKPFTCEHCRSSFSTHSNLKSHYAVHSKESEHYCVECNTYYKTDKNLKRHFNESVRHLKDRNSLFSCKQCSKEFVSSKSLQQHILRHTNAEIIACPQCNKTFSSKSNLNKHVKCIHRDVDS